MIPIHSDEDVKRMRIIGKYTSQLLDEMSDFIKPGLSTEDLDNFAAEFIKKYNLKSACLGYKGHGSIPFPANICTSVNHVICHGIPYPNVILKEGDIVSVDITLIKDGYFGDSCRTFGVGKITQESQNLITITKQAMEIGIQQAFANNYLGNIGYAIEQFIKQSSIPYSIVEEYCGHGIGKKFHQAPQIEHIGRKDSGIKIKEGMFFTIEPMINAGRKETRLLNDHWTVITKDYSLSAQFEHTLGITANGPEIFTQS